MTKALTELNLPLPLYSRGKVRNTYEIPGNENSLLVVTLDRISVGDEPLQSGIPMTGFFLNQLSGFWFKRLEDIIPNHLITCSTTESLFGLDLTKRQIRALKARVMLVKKLDPILAECIVSGYLYGSLLAEYEKALEESPGEQVCVFGHWLPMGMKRAQKLPFPIFRPTTKAPAGEHDKPLTYEEFVDHLDQWLKTKPNSKIRMNAEDLAQFLRSTSVALYMAASSYTEGHGYIMPDGKMEFGADHLTGTIYWIDEGFTPHSSRFWLKYHYKPGQEQDSYDKDPIRNYVKKTGKKVLPKDLINQTQERWSKLFSGIIGLKIGQTFD